MTKAIVTMVACATILRVGAALATPTPQQNCDNARITAWKLYASCVDRVVAMDAKGFISFDDFASFAKCRHTYFKKWAGFQMERLLTGSTCQLGVDQRFTEDALEGVVADNLTGLVWELKHNLDGVTDYTDPHDADNFYSWSTGPPWPENGAAFTTFLTDPTTGLNVTGFAGANGWRLPTLTELQTIVLDFACTTAGRGKNCSCPITSPCVDPALDAANTQPSYYWSATNTLSDPGSAWSVSFLPGRVLSFSETSGLYVRAVRGGW